MRKKTIKTHELADYLRLSFYAQDGEFFTDINGHKTLLFSIEPDVSGEKRGENDVITPHISVSGVDGNIETMTEILIVIEQTHGALMELNSHIPITPLSVYPKRCVGRVLLAATNRNLYFSKHG